MNNSYLIPDYLKDQINLFTKNKKWKLTKLNGSISPKLSTKDINNERNIRQPYTDINDTNS